MAGLGNEDGMTGTCRSQLDEASLRLAVKW